VAQGSMIRASQLYNVLACFKADQENGQYIVRGNLTSFMGAGEEFVLDETAEYRSNGHWCNLLSAVKATSYYQPVAVF
jgi:hypothetical protein